MKLGLSSMAALLTLSACSTEEAVKPRTRAPYGEAQKGSDGAGNPVRPDAPASTPTPAKTEPTAPGSPVSSLPAPAPVPAPAPAPKPSLCSSGEKFSFSNYPDSWNISKTGRIKDAIPNETVIKDAEQGSVLAVKYGKGTTSPSASRLRDLIPGGTQFVPELKGSYENTKMTYWMKIPKDFDCVKGGKLPGMASNVELISGGETADGRNGFTVRLMWRENCTGEVYAYLPREENQHLSEKYQDRLVQNPDTKIIYGWSIGRGEFKFPQGKWFRVGIDVKVNDPEQANGSVKVSIDDKQVFERNEIVYRTNKKLKVGAIFFSTFFGGSAEDYAASKDESLFFGDMEVCSQ